MTRLSVLLALLMCCLLFAPPPSAAQSDLSEQEQAYLTRLMDALNAAPSTEMSRYTLNESVHLSVQFNTNDSLENLVSRLLSSEIAWERVSHVITGDVPNMQAQMLLEYRTPNQSYTMEAEIRLVDEMLYINAAYLESTGEVEALPEGWVRVDDPAAFPEFTMLQLETMREAMENATMVQNPNMADVQKLMQAVNSVHRYQQQVGGQPAFVYVLTLDLQKTLELSADVPSPEIAAANFLPLDAPPSIAIALGQDDTVLGMTLDIGGRVVNEPDPETGLSSDMTMDMFISTYLSNINAPLEPVAAPEAYTVGSPPLNLFPEVDLDEGESLLGPSPTARPSLPLQPSPTAALQIGELVAAQSLDSDGCPVNISSSFSTGSAIYIATTGSRIPAGTRVFARLIANGEILEATSEITAPQAFENVCISFIFEPVGGQAFPPGEYSAQLFVEGMISHSVAFTVR